LSNTKSEARQRYAGALQRSLSCISANAQWRPGPPVVGTQSDSGALITEPGEIRLGTRRGQSDLYLRAAQDFHVYKDPERNEWRCTAERYSYELLTLREDGQEEEFLTWHWHPQSAQDRAHIHANVGHSHVNGVRKLHLPTGRVLFEDVCLFLIRDFGVSTGGRKQANAVNILETVRAAVRAVWHWS